MVPELDYMFYISVHGVWLPQAVKQNVNRFVNRLEQMI